MQATREELIYIHKTIWNTLYRVIKKLGKITPSDLQFYKDGLLRDIYNENIVSKEVLNYVYKHSSCVLCCLYASDFCNNCPLQDCSTPESLYQQILKGSPEDCLKIRDLIYNADIPDYIEIEEK